MGMINKEVVVFQIEDMLSNINKENLLMNGGYIENGKAFLELMANVLVLLKEQPELVRCEDCKHGEPSCNGDVVFCTKDIGTIDSSIHKPDWFCGDGERR